MLSLIKNSLRSLMRSPLRTIILVLILAVSSALSLVMLTVGGAYQNQLSSISSQIGNTVTVRPAGFFGAMGGGEPLDEAKVNEINKIEHVVSVSKSIQTRYSGDALVSAIQPGTLGNQTGQLPEGTNNERIIQGIAQRVGIQVMGYDTSTLKPELISGVSMEVIDGRNFVLGEDDANIAILGKDLATANNIEVGSKININDTDIEIVGIFDSGQRFGNNAVLMPIKTTERIFNITGVTEAAVTVDDANNEDAVVAEIRKIFDENTADITTSSSTYQRISGSLTNAINTSRLAMIISFIAAGIIIMFSIILMIRQKIKEVGVLKAIGASNFRIGFQFVLETFFMSILGTLIGAILTFPLAQRISSLLFSAGSMISNGNLMGGQGFMARGGFTRIGSINIAVSPEIFVYAILFAIAIAIVSSIIPMFYISKVKPAEVLRYE